MVDVISGMVDDIKTRAKIESNTDREPFILGTSSRLLSPSTWSCVPVAAARCRTAPLPDLVHRRASKTQKGPRRSPYSISHPITYLGPRYAPTQAQTPTPNNDFWLRSKHPSSWNTRCLRKGGKLKVGLLCAGTVIAPIESYQRIQDSRVAIWDFASYSGYILIQRILLRWTCRASSHGSAEESLEYYSGRPERRLVIAIHKVRGGRRGRILAIHSMELLLKGV